MVTQCGCHEVNDFIMLWRQLCWILQHNLPGRVKSYIVIAACGNVTGMGFMQLIQITALGSSV